MNSIARETSVLRREGFSPSLSLLMPTFAFPNAPGRVAPAILRRWNAPLPIRAMRYPAPSVSALYPIIIHARTLDQ